jgi:hypothetical protein
MAGMRRFALVLLLVPIPACAPSGGPGDCPGGLAACGDACVDLLESPTHCGRCGNGCGDGYCEAGTCQALPDCSAGCPIGSICDLATNRCVSGCLSDSGCPSGRICEARACVDGCRADGDCGGGRICEGATCRAGCRGDGACATGEICEALTCRAGCRGDGDCAPGLTCDLAALACGCDSDAACGAGSICEARRCRAGCRADADCGPAGVCEATTCRMGCRMDADCGPGSTCVDTTLTCAACAADPDEAGDSRIVTYDQMTDETVVRVLCGASDRDEVEWSHIWDTIVVMTIPYMESITIDVAGAEGGATTRLTLIEGASTTMMSVAGNGSRTLLSRTGRTTCEAFGCGYGNTWTVRIETTSETPVTATVRLVWRGG